MKCIKFLSFVAFVFAGITLFADNVPVPTPDSGTLTTPFNSGINGSGSWATNFNLSFSVTKVGSNYQYLYTLTGNGNTALSPADTFLYLAVDSSVTAANVNSLITMNKGTILAGPQTYVPGNANPGLPVASMYAIDFSLLSTSGSQILEFTSSLPPVWGDFYAQNTPTSTFAYNSGFVEGSPNSGNVSQPIWVPTVGPAGVSAPEPATILILGSGIVTATLTKYRRKQQAN